MCWGERGYYFCYECHGKFNHFDGFTPCYRFENGVSCGHFVPRDEVIQTGDTCDQCKSARAAEETCQQKVCRLKPVMLFDRRERAKVWNANYQAGLEDRKAAIRQQKAKEAAEKAIQDANPDANVVVSQKGEEPQEEDLAPAPPFITMRHQFNT